MCLHTYLSTSLAATGDHIELLGYRTSVSDRVLENGYLLSQELNELSQFCSANHQERSDRFYLCVRRIFTQLKKADLITAQEYRRLKHAYNNIRDGISAPALSTINLSVTKLDGSPATNVLVSDANNFHSIITDDTGHATLTNVFAQTNTVLHLTGNNYANQIIPIRTPDQNQTIDIDVMVKEREIAQITIDSATGEASATTAEGATVSFAQGSFETPTGRIVLNEDVQLSVTPINVSSTTELQALPGSSNTQANGVIETLASLGAVEFHFTAKHNERNTPLQLASGSQALIEIPIYYSSLPNTNSDITNNIDIPLWSLDETTGQWMSEGAGMIVRAENSPSGFALKAAVKHFSWWNTAVPMHSASVNMSVSSSAHTGIVTVTSTTNKKMGWRPNAMNTILMLNSTPTKISIPANVEICFKASKQTYFSPEEYSDTQCVTMAKGSTENLTLSLDNHPETKAPRFEPPIDKTSAYASDLPRLLCENQVLLTSTFLFFDWNVGGEASSWMINSVQWLSAESDSATPANSQLVSINPSNGMLQAPACTGQYHISVTASNQHGSDSIEFLLLTDF